MRYSGRWPIALSLWMLVGVVATSEEFQPRPAAAQEAAGGKEAGKAETKGEGKSEAKKPPTPEELYKKFAEEMSGVKLVGQFTVVGKEVPPAKEEYSILSATKMENGDFWLLQARIKYGGNDVTLPLPIEIKWAGTTPVITLDNFTIPGMGTFSARVLFHGKTYAGTWTHDKVGGHMFGTLEKLPAK